MTPISLLRRIILASGKLASNGTLSQRVSPLSAFSTCAFPPGTKYVFKTLFEERGLSFGTVPLHTWGSTSQQEPCNTKHASGAGTRHASLDLFLGFLGASGRDQGGTWYSTSAKPERHFTKGMIGKPLTLSTEHGHDLFFLHGLLSTKVPLLTLLTVVRLLSSPNSSHKRCFV